MSGRKAILIGTSGWSYAHWKGPFYPRDLPARRMLEYYAERFETVELNATFYRLPQEHALKQWHDGTPPGFVFAAKASRYITHVRKLNDPKRTGTEFFKRIRLLGSKLGPVLFQLPPRWRFNETRLAAFLAALPSDLRYAFELRDQDWLNERAYELLRRHDAAFCIYDFNRFLSPKLITSSFVYVRLHGPDGPYQGSYGTNALSTWAQLFLEWAASGREVYCYFDNDQSGYAAKNAARLRGMIGR